MASRFEQDTSSRTECENCGETGDLLRCSRCHNAWFCSLKCHKSYWPFHKPACKPNQFADAMEAADPKFAQWMRGHGKLAVVKDDEVERLERASQPGGWQGLGREEVMDSMYGLVEPKPKGPRYTPEELLAMQQAALGNKSDTSQLYPGPTKPWQELVIPEGLGLDCGRYKWRQNLSHVEVFVQLPATISSKQVHVSLSPASLCVVLVDDEVLRGKLYQEVKVEDSTWFVDADTHILHLSLLKRNRKGHYANGSTNASTYWWALMQQQQATKVSAGQQQQQQFHRLPGDQPPMRYYWSSYEADDLTA